jgi:pepF/M3 family oligoendopeptidase
MTQSECPSCPQTWELDSILPHPATTEFRAVLQEFITELSVLAGEFDAPPPLTAAATHVASWKKLLKRYEAIEKRANDLASFAGCHAAAEAANSVFQKLEAELSALEPLRAKIATAIEFAVKMADAEALQQMLSNDAQLAELKFFFDERRRNAALRLPLDQEQLANDLAVDAIHAWGRLYDQLSGGLRITVMEKGELVEKSPGQVMFDSPQRAVRENHFYAAKKAWTSIQEPCAAALNHIAGFRLTKYRHLGLTGDDAHLVAPLRCNRMRRETLDAMWNSVTARKPVLLKYLAKKAELLGLQKLTWYDVTAPLPLASRGSAVELSYDEACRIVTRTFHGFSPDLGEFAELAIRNRWIEVENRPGKRQGGFCTGLPTKRESRIFMTWTNSVDSMSTLAHELGHAYHSHVLWDRPFFLQDYPMNLAETASTFAEAVLGEEQLRMATSTDEQLKLLDHMLGDAVAFLMNIHARFLFEDRFHRERRNGEVPHERLSELMLAAQQEAYLHALADDGWYPQFWISKLHFYISSLPFYNFPYTFGYLLSLGTFAIAKSDPRDFPARYRQLLIATGCCEAEEAVRSTLGEDLTRPEFWNRSLDVVEQRVARFLELANSR